MPARKHLSFLALMKRYRWIAIDTLLFCGGLFLLLTLRHQLWPDEGVPLHYTTELHHTSIESVTPLVVHDGPRELHVSLPLNLHLVYPHSFLVQADDCMTSLVVNGQAVPSDVWANPTCNYLLKKRIDLGAYLHAGLNMVDVTITNAGGDAALYFAPDRLDPVMLSIEIGIVLLCVWYVLMWYGHAPDFWRRQKSMVWMTVIAIGLRFIYVASTSPFERGHDVDGHIQYVQYVLAHWSVPQASAGWQFYQPPLYYFLSAAWLSLHVPKGILFGPFINHLQYFALLLSCASVFVLVSLSRLLFFSKEDRHFAPLFVALTTCVPSLIFLAARINNDVLFAFLSIVVFLFLWRWWQGHKVTDWIFLVVLLGLCSLTKSNGSVLIALAFTCLLFARMRMREKILTAIGSVFLLMIIVGWHILLRSRGIAHDDLLLVGNLTNLNSALRLPAFSLYDSLLTFHPLAVLRHPFNNAFDIPLSQHFGEYFYRSMFFGEFNFGAQLTLLASFILASGYILVAFFLIGLYAMLRRNPLKTLPIWLTFVAVLGAHIVFRMIAPYTCSQDFRYSLLLLIPFAYGIVRGIRSLPRPAQILGCIASVVFVIACSAFIVAVFIIPV